MKKSPRRRFACQGEILKKIKHKDLYKVLFFPLFEKEPKISWFSTEDIADFILGSKRKRCNFNNE